MAVQHPPHALHALATFELRDYRAYLERAIAALPPTASTVDDLRGRLADVITEQQARQRESE